MIARSVQKAAAVENSSLIMGLGSHRPRRTRTAEGSLHGGGGGGGCERITFRSFLPLGARWTYTDGRRRVRQREERGGGEREQNYQRRTKTSRGKRGDWRRIQILLLCRKEAWKREGEGETDRRADDATRAAQNSHGHGQVCRKGTSTSLCTVK